jgi:homoserine kinase
VVCKRSIAYSSSANLGSGFDILSVAHDAFYDEVEACTSEGRLKVVMTDNSNIPEDPTKNSAGFSVLSLMKDYGIKEGVILKVKKGIPAGLGLGSSGASAAAAVAAVNSLFSLGLSKDSMVKYSMLGEGAIAGSPHPDNVAASIFGGFVAVLGERTVNLNVNYDFKFILFIPSIEAKDKTKKARELVPKTVDMSSYVKNMRFGFSLMLGLERGDRKLISNGLNDEIVEKARLPMFPFYPELKKISLSHNAIGACVSGAGPSILVLVDHESEIKAIEEEGKKLIASFGYSAQVKEAKIAGGVKVE